MSVLSVDPGLRHMSMCVMRGNQLLHWDTIDLLEGKTTKAMPSVEHTIDRIVLELDSLRQTTGTHQLEDIGTVIVEKQPHTNARMRVIEGSLLTFFKCRYPSACVKTYSPRYKLKGQKGTETYSARKKLAVTLVTELLASDCMHVSDEQRDMFKSTKKKDDLADSLLMCVKYQDLPCPCFQPVG